MDKTLYGILSVAGGDLAALVSAVVHVVEERHYNQQGAMVEVEQVIVQLRDAVAGDEAKSRWRRPRAVASPPDAA